MIYLKEFDSHASYETEINLGGVGISIPNVSYCKDANDVHFNPYNLIEFYVSEITGTTPQTVSIYTDNTHHEDVTVSEGNKWYTYVLMEGKKLYRIEGDSVKKVVVVKADISFIGESNHPGGTSIVSTSTVEASFKGSNTNHVTDMGCMFFGCSGLTSLDVSNFDTSKVTSMHYMFDSCKSLISLDLSGWNTSNVTDMALMFDFCGSLAELNLSGWVISDGTSMNGMFNACTSLNTIKMVDCTTETITKIEEALTAAGIKDNVKIKTT